MSNTLTPSGAQLLRIARDNIVAHPETFDWTLWCGSRCCIGGHIAKAMGVEISALFTLEVPASLLAGLGFDLNALQEADVVRMRAMFYGYRSGKHIFDISAAVRAINAFLWAYGYPADEIPAPPASKPNESQQPEAAFA